VPLAVDDHAEGDDAFQEGGGASKAATSQHKGGVLDQQLALINQHNGDSQRMLADTKELYASAEARANTLIKREEDLTTRVRTIDERSQASEQLEERLLEREELDDLNLNRELEGLATSESILEHREAALEVEQKALEDAHVTVFSH
jgi:hypothetical protein